MSNEKFLNLSSLAPAKGSRKTRKRKGLGESSGLGKTSGRGHKGQRARTSGNVRVGFEGGQMPLYRRLPKIGFTSRKKLAGENLYTVISTTKLVKIADKCNKQEITLQLLKDLKVVKGKSVKVKILAGKADFNKQLVIEVHAISATAKEVIEKAGGQVKILEG
ncbi:MAG: 50S ribosomal protein L15 [Deltaproteobacteria bacterium]|jgi:large subunit ribosomal protein L15|nr:50S ribosomal protein L15 [Deltaproteobacteria bacterium]